MQSPSILNFCKRFVRTFGKVFCVLYKNIQDDIFEMTRHQSWIEMVLRLISEQLVSDLDVSYTLRYQF